MSAPYSILIVEDDPGFTSYLNRLLHRDDLKLFTASNGRQAIECLNRNTIDIVLQDIGLPDIDGYQVMDRIRQQFPDVLVIVMTGEVTVESAVQALRKGAYDYLRKPFESTDLVNTVENALGRLRLEQQTHQAEEELRKTKQRLQHVLTSSPAVIYACNPSGDCATTFISKNVKTELGHDSEDFVNDPHFWIDHIHPDDIQYVKDEFSKLVDRGSHVLEYRFQHKNGSYRWMRDELRLFFGEKGKTVEVVGSWTDISDMKQAEEALRKSEQQFRDLIENSPVGISIIQNGRVVYQNPQQNKIYSFSSDSDILKFLDYVHSDDIEKVKQAYQRLASGELNTIEIDFRFYPPGCNGNKPEMKWFQLRVTRFQYQGKDALLLNAVDISEAKQLEHQLLIKNKMLSLGRVAAGIAHEIRNPLTGINTYLYTIDDLCRSDRLEPQDMEIIRQIVTQIQVASNKIESVIKRVMDFSKPGAPKMVRTNINESLVEAIKLSSVTMRKIGIQFETSLAPDLPRCYADPHLIEQVVLNLITNAARAMEKSNGERIVEIRSSAKNNTLSIQVADSGPGVPVELREKIFDPFFTTKEDGSGIGLNIAQRIVADHNGSISLHSSKWGGAEFRIELPIERRIDA
jgi:PAS domain S-box-containing protein